MLFSTTSVKNNPIAASNKIFDPRETVCVVIRCATSVKVVPSSHRSVACDRYYPIDHENKVLE